jgi:hypothetical protein
LVSCRDLNDRLFSRVALHTFDRGLVILPGDLLVLLFVAPDTAVGRRGVMVDLIRVYRVGLYLCIGLCVALLTGIACLEEGGICLRECAYMECMTGFAACISLDVSLVIVLHGRQD